MRVCCLQSIATGNDAWGPCRDPWLDAEDMGTSRWCAEKVLHPAVRTLLVAKHASAFIPASQQHYPRRGCTANVSFAELYCSMPLWCGCSVMPCTSACAFHQHSLLNKLLCQQCRLQNLESGLHVTVTCLDGNGLRQPLCALPTVPSQGTTWCKLHTEVEQEAQRVMNELRRCSIRQ